MYVCTYVRTGMVMPLDNRSAFVVVDMPLDNKSDYVTKMRVSNRAHSHHITLITKGFY